MSRIGKLPIPIPDAVKVDIRDRTVTVQGPKGTLSLTAHPAMQVGNDHTLFAKIQGYVKFEDKASRGRFVNIFPATQ